MFGMPSYDLFLAERRGEVDVVLAGCTVSFETRHCRACGHEWADDVELEPHDRASVRPEPGA